jgi:natural product biosynthesis luciferase-like monooxygenase protein
MRFGLHYQLPCSPDQSPVQRYRDTIEQAVHAEQLGFESIWPVEQHFNADFSILPSPLLLLASVAARTTKLRLGIAIILLPLAHPIRVAEDVATLDVLSNGRVEFGIGRGVFPTHFAGFGVPQSESRERLLENLHVILQAWTKERFSFHGKFFEIEDLSVVPKPVQQPHPPILVAANTVETYEQMGKLAYPILTASQITTYPKLREFIPLYRQAREAAGHAPARPQDITVLSPTYVAVDAAQVRREIEPSIKHFLQSLINAFPAAGDGKGGSNKLLQEAADRLRKTTYEQVNQVMGIFETPDVCVERIKKLQDEFNMGRMLCWFNPGGQVPHVQVMRSMELFAAKVMPHFA